MKEKMIPLLLLTAIVAATMLFAAREQHTTEQLDKMQATLQPVNKMVPESAAISFQNIPVNNELHFFARYTLAPRYLPFHKQVCDTLLTICEPGKKDSIAAAYTAERRRIVWQASEDGNVYLLTVKE